MADERLEWRTALEEKKLRESKRKMADYMEENPEKYSIKADASEAAMARDEMSVASKRKNLMFSREQCDRRLKFLASQKMELEAKRREVIFLMEAEEALIEGANKALSKMDSYDHCDEAEETPTENMPVSAAYDKNRGRGW